MNVTVTAEPGPPELYLSAPECTVELQTARPPEEASSTLAGQDKDLFHQSRPELVQRKTVGSKRALQARLKTDTIPTGRITRLG